MALILRCWRDAECDAYQYKATGPGNCLLILKASSEDDGYSFLSTEQYSVNKKGSVLVTGYVLIRYFVFLNNLLNADPRITRHSVKYSNFDRLTLIIF